MGSNDPKSGAFEVLPLMVRSTIASFLNHPQAIICRRWTLTGRLPKADADSREWNATAESGVFGSNFAQPMSSLKPISAQYSPAVFHR